MPGICNPDREAIALKPQHSVADFCLGVPIKAHFGITLKNSDPFSKRNFWPGKIRPSWLSRDVNVVTHNLL